MYKLFKNSWILLLILSVENYSFATITQSATTPPQHPHILARGQNFAGRIARGAVAAYTAAIALAHTAGAQMSSTGSATGSSTAPFVDESSSSAGSTGTEGLSSFSGTELFAPILAGSVGACIAIVLLKNRCYFRANNAALLAMDPMLGQPQVEMTLAAAFPPVPPRRATVKTLAAERGDGNSHFLGSTALTPDQCSEIPSDDICTICQHEFNPIRSRSEAKAAESSRSSSGLGSVEANNSDALAAAVKINNCGHIFHKDCLPDWISRSALCPTCRTDMCGCDKCKGPNGEVRIQIAPEAVASDSVSVSRSNSDHEREISHEINYDGIASLEAHAAQQAQ